MTIEQVYNIIQEYAVRNLFISELSQMLGISYAHANELTICAGFRRTKKVLDITLDAFAKEKSVLYIVDKIK